MTLQNPGEIIYVPSGSKRASYAIQDSFSVIKSTLARESLNTVIDENEINVDSLVPSSEMEL